MQVEAIAGAPFGVGRITVPGAQDVPGDPWADGRIDLFEGNGRILYPVYSDGPVRQFLRQFIQFPRAITIFFLFQGDAPMNVTVTTPAPITLPVTPRRLHPAAHRRLLSQWWLEYTRAAERHSRSSDYPGMVDTYLTSTLARRLSLRPPNLIPQGPLRPAMDDGMELLMGTERMKTLLQQRNLLAANAGLQGNLRPMPPTPNWPPLRYPDVAGDVTIEPMAMHVPADCLYLRSGTFANYVWMQVLMEEWGGEIRNMISYRGVDYGINARIERQLGLKETALSRALGGTLISDVAVIGADPFFREGAAVGMLFEATNSFLLKQSLSKQRSDAMERAGAEATETMLEIEGVEVSYAGTADGTLRSYYAADGKYHLVTSSRKVMEEFLRVSQSGGKGSLGASAGFRYARSLVPVERDDTIFLYLSDEFFQRLAGPQYRIEMHRRLRSITDMQSLELARYAAVAEGRPAKTVDELIAADLLPRGFDLRADGSRIVVGQDQMTDSLRGTLGSFLPVPDVPIDRISSAEASDYADFVQAYASSPSRMDPMILAVKRAPSGVKELEVVTVDALVAPLRAAQFQRIARFLGPTRDHRIRKVDGDLLRVDGIGPRGNYLFLGIQEFNPPLAVQGGRVRWTLPNFDTARGYLGGSPSLGVLETLMGLILGGPGAADARGYVLWPLGLWQRSTGAMTVLSFDRAVLDWVTPQLTTEQLASPAQIHVDVADLSQTKLASAVNALGFEHTRNVSIGNTALLQSLARQVRVPPEQCRGVAERLLGARLMCSLDGQYELKPSAGGRKTWVSTAWSGANQAALTQIPADYVFPVMKWFRGMNAQAAVRQDIISLQANLLMRRHPKIKGFNLPNLFKPKDPPPPPDDIPDVDLPKVEPPRVDLPKVDLPGVEIPNVEVPGGDTPKPGKPEPELLPPPKPILPDPQPAGKQA